jgi:hypothetical protein
MVRMLLAISATTPSMVGVDCGAGDWATAAHVSASATVAPAIER